LHEEFCGVKIKVLLGQQKVLADHGHDGWVLVRLLAPAQPADARRPPLAVLPVVDVSSSMEGPKLDAVKHALTQLIAHLVPSDFVGLVSFSGEARVILPITEVSQDSRGRLQHAIKSLLTDGLTNLAEGFLVGRRALEEAALPASLRARLVLLTDGQANRGVATGRPELRALVQQGIGPFSLSAFGFGKDCDHAMLGELADEGGGSFAYIQNEDGVLSAFARELGGLVSTYAADVRVRLAPTAGSPREERIGDILYQGEFPWCVPIAIPRHAAAGNVEVARIEVQYRDAFGRDQSLSAPVLVDYVPPGEEDRELDPRVLLARDERLLNEAQVAAEGHAQRDDYAGAARVLAEAVGRLSSPQLVAFAHEVLLPSYQHQRAYLAAAPVRASTDKALKKRRMLAASQVVAERLGEIAQSSSEDAMEKSFRTPPKGTGG
jgi:uncharacterized protein YegL